METSISDGCVYVCVGLSWLTGNLPNQLRTAGGVMQEIIVTVIVFCAAVAVIKRYAPNSWKRLVRISAVRFAVKLGWNGLAAKITEKAEAEAEGRGSCGTVCGSCGSCGSDAAATVEKKSSISPEALKRTIRR